MIDDKRRVIAGPSNGPTVSEEVGCSTGVDGGSGHQDYTTQCLCSVLLRFSAPGCTLRWGDQFVATVGHPLLRLHRDNFSAVRYY